MFCVFSQAEIFFYAGLGFSLDFNLDKFFDKVSVFLINKRILFLKIFSITILYIVALIIQVIGYILVKKTSNLDFAIVFLASGALPFCPLFFIVSTFMPKKLLPLKIIVYFFITLILVCFILLCIVSVNNDFIVTPSGGVTW